MSNDVVIQFSFNHKILQLKNIEILPLRQVFTAPPVRFRGGRKYFDNFALFI
jgi:hypothetical protein